MPAGADVIVCGAGTAGPVVAARLVQGGASVLLLEAGPDHGALPDGRWPTDLLDATRIPTSHDWGYVSQDGGLPFERARVIGGCSAHNGCTASWGHRADYDGWGLAGWKAATLQPLFEEASRRMRVRLFEEGDWSPLHRAFIEAGVALGLPLEDRLQTLDVRPSVCAEPSNSPGGIRWNAALAYLDPVRGDPRLTIQGDTLVDRVLIEDGRALGVRAIGPDGPFEARAGRVVLAGGTYGSPAMLLRSGIGPAQDLAALGIEVAVDLPGVGANLHDHPSFAVAIRPSEEYTRRTAAFATSGRALPDELGFSCLATSLATDGVIDLHLFSVDDALGSEEDLPGLFVTCLTPRSKGLLRLRSADPVAAPILDHAFLSDPDGHDLAVLVEGVEHARRFLATAPLAALVDAEVTPGADAVLPAAIRAGVQHCWHPVGTCAMGDVTDERGAVRGVEGLTVADASLMPQTVRATTNLPTVTIGERIAAFLCEDAR
ncbi:MAG: GMC family oxidoreductase N-terminal domain-containing protein [Actinomycetota bacterium]